MIFSPVVQNDKRLNEQTNDAGCLFRSLGMGAEIHARHTMSPGQIEEQYAWLVGEQLMKPNCWVLNHEKVITAAQYYLGVRQAARYVFRDEGDEKDFGSPDKCNFFIRHVRTKTGTGHFYVSTRDGQRLWDPYWPAPAVDYVIGIRGYRVG